MALFRKLFYRKPPDGLLEICERVYVFDRCFTTDPVVDQDYKGYVGDIITQLKEHYPDASILAFNFREGQTQSQIANALTDYDMTIMEYPRQYEGCPLLPMEVIHHFLRSSESWLSLGLQNLLLMHCERGGWPVLAFMLAALLIYRKHYSGELKTLDMVYKQAPRELLHLLSPLNPVPSQLRYLQYVSRRNVATEWPPLDRALTMDCVIIRTIPNFDGEGGCRPIFRIYGQDPFHVSDRTPKVLFSTPKKSRTIRHYKQAECELVKIDINCLIQGDVVLECICLSDDKEREVMMFRVMFNTAFIRSNILMLNRDEIDILWDAKDLFPKDFRAEVLFSELDSVASEIPMDCSCFEEKDGLPVEAFAKVQEIFSSVDWLVPKGDATVDVLQHLSVEAYSHAEKCQVNQRLAALDVKTVANSTTNLTSENQSNISPNLSPNADVDRNQNVKIVAKSTTNLTSENQSNISPKLSPKADVDRNQDIKTVAKSTTSLTSENQSKTSPKLSPNADVDRNNDVKTVDKSTTSLTSENQSNISPKLSPNADVDRDQDDPRFEIRKIISPDQTLIPPGDLSIAKSDSNAQNNPVVSREAGTLHSNTFPSAPVTRPIKNADVPGRLLSTLATFPLTPNLEDKTGVQSGISPLPLLPPEIPSASTSPLKDDTPFRPSTFHKKVQRVGDSQDESPRSTEDVVEAKTVATAPPPPPSPPPTHSSSTVDVEELTKFVTPPSTATQSSVLNVIEPTGHGSSPHMSFVETDTTHKTAPCTHPSPPPCTTPIQESSASTCAPVPPAPLPSPITHKTAPHTQPPPPPCTAPIQESSASTFAPTPPAPFPSPTSVLKKNSDSEVGHPPPTPSSPHVTKSSVNKPSPCPPPPPPPPALTPLVSYLEEDSSPGVVPQPPHTPPLRDNSVSRIAPRPPPPPPVPPKSISNEEVSPLTPPPPHSGQGAPLLIPPAPSPPPPPPPPPEPPRERSSGGETPPPPHSGQATPPLIPPLRNGSIAKLAPCPPPPPSPPSSPHPGKSAGSTNMVTSSPPPPPPPAPANYVGTPTSSAPSVPLAPPPPILSPREPGNSSPSSSGKIGNLLGSPSPPGPPPPSTPPLGTRGKSSLSRSVTSRSQSKKLKPLHWLKISRAVSGSLWAEAQKSGEASRAPEIDITELESLFSAVPNADQGGRKSGSRGSMGNKSEKVQLIEHRRAYNCEIMLSKVKIPLHDMLSSVLALEDSALDVDQVDNLIKFCPTKEEMEVLKGYKGEKDKLGKCEQFFLELMQVPRIEYKLRVFSFKIQFHTQVSDLRKNLNVVNSAVEQIRCSAKLKRIMQTILSLGNALNQGTARGSAIGFRLDSLLKLTETRALNNKMTLMHYLCKVLSDKLPELLDFWKDLSSLEPASKIQLKFLAEEMQAINKGLEKVMQELSMSESDGPVSDHFRQALKEFLRFSEGEVRSLASLYAGVGRNVDSLILYFGEDPSRCPFEQVISTLLNFVRMFKQSHDENCKQLESERKKAEKEASEKLKMKASDTEHLLQSQVRSVK